MWVLSWLVKHVQGEFMTVVSVKPKATDFIASPPRVLVVEDEWLIRFMLSDSIRSAGYHVVEASSADEALVIFGTAVPDMIITDVRMPGSLDGIGLLAQIRKTHATLPVIITSSHLDESLAPLDCATHFVAKPYSIDLISRMVEQELVKPN